MEKRGRLVMMARFGRKLGKTPVGDDHWIQSIGRNQTFPGVG